MLVAAAMLATGYSYLIDPELISCTATWGMAFPFFVGADLIFIVVWLILKPRKIWVPILALRLCLPPTEKYCGLSIINPKTHSNQTSDSDVDSTTEQEAPTLKLLSFNTYHYQGYNEKYTPHTCPIGEYLIEQDADIICLQECNPKGLSAATKDALKKIYPYSRYDHKGGVGTYLAIYSKYPIEKMDSVPYESRCNFSLAYTLRTPQGHILVINNHLESNCLTAEERRNFTAMVKGDMTTDSIRLESMNIYAKLTEASVRRAAQAKAVAEYIDLHSDMPTILMGDFNETPVSYNHHVIAKRLNDCFISRGRGLGWTYCHSGIRARIDNIMVSKHFNPLQCHVDQSIEYSDHYPIIAYVLHQETH